MKSTDPTDNPRPIFDWVIWSVIHIVLVGAIWYAGLSVYGPRLGHWVGASALIAGLVSMYLFAKVVPGETLMKVWLGLCVALNAGYIVHCGAQMMGIEAYNAAQIEKFEKGMAVAAQATSRRVAREIGLSAQTASQIEKAFGSGQSLIAAILAFLELSSSIVIFAIGSRRAATEQEKPQPERNEFPSELPVEAGK
jgi:hypothetical protein